MNVLNLLCINVLYWYINWGLVKSKTEDRLLVLALQTTSELFMTLTYSGRCEWNMKAVCWYGCKYLFSMFCHLPERKQKDRRA